MTTINVRMGPLAEAIEDVRSCHRALSQQQSDLEGFLKQFKSTWAGGASLTWQQAQDDWNAACEDVIGILYDLFVALEVASGNYTGTEKALQRLWGGS